MTLLWLLVLCAAAASAAPVAVAQQRSVTWERYDADLDVQPDGAVRVTETQTIRFQGTYQQGFRVVPTDRVTAIDDASVSEIVSGQSVTYRSTLTQTPNGFRTSVADQGLRIDWWFPSTTDASRTFVVRYTARGAIRIYDAGDQLQWKALYADRPAPVTASMVTVRLPANAQQSSFSRYTQDQQLGGLASSGTGQQIDPRTVQFNIGSLPAGTGAETRVQFDHGVVSASPPPWQADADRADFVQQTVGPIAGFLALLLTLVVVAGGGAALFLMWYTSGRDPPHGAVPASLEQPPSDLPAPMAGTLVDEVADVQDAVATLVDLAQRGVLSLSDDSNPGLAGSSHDVRITLRGSPDAAKPRRYEDVLLYALFDRGAGTGHEVLLSAVRRRFEATIPMLQDALHRAVADAGLFVSDPETVRKRYTRLGWLVAGAGVVLMALGTVFLGGVVGVAWMPGLAVTLVGSVLIKLAAAMPRRTSAGALEAARWRAFRAHLTSAEAAQRPDLLPYAVAFGIDRSFLTRLESVGSPPPTWYPGPSGSGWGTPGGVVVLPGGFGSGEGTWRGPTAPSAPDAGGFGVPEVSGPQGWSDGLADLLNAASQALSSGGGSGGWSGGGFGGGGGGGGGSGGFQ